MERIQNLSCLHAVADFIDLQIRFSRKCIVERMAWFQSYRDHHAVRRKLCSAAGPVIHSAHALICDSGRGTAYGNGVDYLFSVQTA